MGYTSDAGFFYGCDKIKVEKCDAKRRDKIIQYGGHAKRDYQDAKRPGSQNEGIY